MPDQRINLETWDRTETFRFFQTFEKPHFSITARADVTRLMAAKERDGVSIFRACMWALACGANACPELRTRFEGDAVTLYDQIDVSPVVSMPDGSYRFAYVPFSPDWAEFDARAAKIIDGVRQGAGLNPDEGGNGVAYMSALPWIDFTSLTNAIRVSDDSIPRLAWGKIVPKAEGFDMAVGIELHHAVADGRHAGLFFEATQAALSETDF